MLSPVECQLQLIQADDFMGPNFTPKYFLYDPDVTYRSRADTSTNTGATANTNTGATASGAATLKTGDTASGAASLSSGLWSLSLSFLCSLAVL